jgi:hypothetical protein
MGDHLQREPGRHPVDRLWDQRKPPNGYPHGVLEIRDRIRGLSFFPGGNGLYNAQDNPPLPPFPTGGVMVLGHDFDSKAGYEKSKTRGRESDTGPTWRGLSNVLEVAGINRERCFFTNFFVGLREGSKNTGRFPGARDRPFVDHCASFLILQLNAQRPSLVLTLGAHVPHLIARLSPELAEWRKARRLMDVDSAGPVRYGVTFPQIPDFRTTVVALTHPCLRSANVHSRRYRDKCCNEAELEMLRDALSALPPRISRNISRSDPGSEFDPR